VKTHKFSTFQEFLETLLDGMEFGQDISPGAYESLIKRVYRDSDPQLADQGLLELIRMLMAQTIINSVEGHTKQDRLLGLMLVYSKSFIPLNLGKSTAKVFASIGESHVSEAVYELFEDYYRAIRTPNKFQLTGLQSAIRTSTNVSARTALRYYDKAGELLKRMLIDVGLDVFESDRKAQVMVSQPDIVPASTDKTPQTSLDAMLREYSMKKYSRAPEAFGVALPIVECEPRQFMCREQSGSINSLNFVFDLAGNSGVILSALGDGITTTLMSIAYQNNKIETSKCLVFHLSITDYLEHAKQGAGLWQYLAKEILAGKCDGTQLLQQVVHGLEELNCSEKLILLVDDLTKHDVDSQKVALTQFAGAHSVYFSVLAGHEIEVLQVMLKHGIGRSLMLLKLKKLDDISGENIAKRFGKKLGVDYQDGDVGRHFRPFGADTGITPLEIGAYLASEKATAAPRDLAFSWILLVEIIQRAGFETPWITRDVEKLVSPVRDLVEYGRLLTRHLAISLAEEGVISPRQGTWIGIDVIKSGIEGAMETLLSTGLFQISSYFLSVRMISVSIERLLCLLGYYYFGAPEYTWLERLFLDQDWLDSIQMESENVPTLFDLTITQDGLHHGT